MHSLRDSQRFHQLRHRWVAFPSVMPAGKDMEHALQQRQQLLPVPHLMQLPDQFQVYLECTHQAMLCMAVCRACIGTGYLEALQPL